ncbi:MAG: glycosyl hydrolase, partial [Bacteroidota bacterium]
MAFPTSSLDIKPTSASERKAAADQKKLLQQQSIFKHYPIRNIGPTVMGGRIVDIEAHPDQANQYYVAYASGGLYKTTNNGLSFTSIFDNQDRLTIGDIALSPANKDILWVGTGENNSSRSSYAGYGVYKSSDGGKTWSHQGLSNTQHIGRIIAHPRDPDIAWVASIGALYSKNPERGVFKTKDGGKTWEKTLFVNDSTGVIDLIINPNNPDQLWAAAWERHRYAWEFKENGPGSGLYMSEDGGESWKEMNQGLPPAADRGRIGLDICREQPNTLYLIMDNQGEVKEKKEDTEKLKYSFADFQKMSVQQFLAIND